MSFFWQAILVEGGMAVLAILIAFFSGLDFLSYCQFGTETLYMTSWALFLLMAAYCIFRLLPLAALKRIDRIVRELYWQHMSHLSLAQLALIAALAGIGEELLFRGVIQLGLGELGLGRLSAILISSLLFGGVHAITPTYCLLAFAISFYLGFLFSWSDNIIVPITVHAFYDLFVFLFIRWSPKRAAFVK